MTPESQVNRALDLAGASEQSIGDIQQGTTAARVALRHYIPCLEQLTRAAYWNTHRKQAPMQLLGAAPGYGPAVPQGQTPPYGSRVIQPWCYEYAWPPDCIAARFVPWNNSLPPGGTPAGNIAGPPTPQTTFDQSFQSPAVLIPARMLVASDANYPLPISADTPPQQWWNTRGAAPDIRTVILTNVPCAELVYTAFIPYPNLWDPLFQEAFADGTGPDRGDCLVSVSGREVLLHRFKIVFLPAALLIAGVVFRNVLVCQRQAGSTGNR